MLNTNNVELKKKRIDQNLKWQAHIVIMKQIARNIVAVNLYQLLAFSDTDLVVKIITVVQKLEIIIWMMEPGLLNMYSDAEIWVLKDSGIYSLR